MFDGLALGRLYTNKYGMQTIINSCNAAHESNIGVTTDIFLIAQL